MKHAMTNVGEFVIPLIGIPEDATMGDCECCGDSKSIWELKWSDAGQLLCMHCQDK